MATATRSKPKTTPKADPALASKRIADLLHHLADPTRVQIVALLADRDYHVSDLVAAIGAKQPAVSHHLSLLRAARIVESDRDGKMVRYQLSDTGKRLVAVIRHVAE